LEWWSPTGWSSGLYRTWQRLHVADSRSGLSYIDGGRSPLRWRFPIGFQIIPLLILLGAVWFFPESPRWLAKVGRHEESRYILGRLRGETGDDYDRAEAEFQEIKAVADMEINHAIPTSYWGMLLDRGELHLGRRVQLVVWLQIIQEWVGIAGVTLCKCRSSLVLSPMLTPQMRLPSFV
jgi:hypothetical protein